MQVYVDTRLVVVEPVSLDNAIDAAEARAGVTVSGRAAVDEGQLVELSTGDTLLGTAVVAADGSWSIDGVVLEGSPDMYGETRLSASVVDPSGGRSYSDWIVRVDTRLATIEPIGLGSSYGGVVDSADMGSVTLTGLAVGAQGQQLELLVDGELLSTTVVGADSYWRIDMADLGATPGERQLTINVTDTAGTALSANSWFTVVEGASPLEVVVSGDNYYESIDTVEETYGVTISSGSNDNLKGLQLEVFVDEVSVGTTVADGETGSWESRMGIARSG